MQQSIPYKQIASTSKARLKTYVFLADKQQHAIPLFLKSNFLPIQMIYFEKTARLMYDISTNINEAPSLIQQLFTKAGNAHGYGTRSATRGNYYVKFS